MNHFHVSLLLELCLAFGLAGLFWPDKFLSVFDVLMFPWAASYRLVRTHCVIAIATAALLFSLLITGR